MTAIMLNKNAIYKSGFLLIISLFLGLVAGCTEEDNGQIFTGNDNAIVSFSLKSGEQLLPVNVYADSLLFPIPEGFSMEGAEARYELTQNSEIAPDPAEISDWSGMHEFVLTAPDGETTRTYTFMAKDAAEDAGVEGFYVLKSQEEVNAMADLNLKSVLGISVNGSTESPVTDLSPLSSIEEVQYHVNVNNFQGKELHGLENIRKATSINIAGDSLEVIHLEALKTVNNFTVGLFGSSAETSKAPILKEIFVPNLEIVYNTLLIRALQLNGVTHFNSLREIGGEATLTIGGNSLEGLNNLEKAFNLSVTVMNATDLSGLDKLTYVEREFRIQFMSRLTSLNGLHLEKVKNININNVQSLTDITALENITELDNLFISGATRLGSLEGLHNLERVRNAIALLFIGTPTYPWAAGTGITNLDGLRSLKSVGGGFEIRNCPNLTDYCAIQTALESFQGSWYLLYNGFNPSLEEVRTTCKQEE